MADNVIIREAQREDCPAIIKLSVVSKLSLITSVTSFSNCELFSLQEIADFHKHFNSPQLDPKGEFKRF